VTKESRIMRDIHRLREKFYNQTKGKSREDILKLIKEGSDEVKQELEVIKEDPNLIVKRKYSIPPSDSVEEIHLIRERRAKYGKGKRK
jgi:hypothetical protein